MTDSVSISLPKILANMDIARLTRYQDNLDFYNGSHWQTSNQAVKRRLTFNYAKVFIDKLTSYVMSGISPVVHHAADTPQEKSRARAAEDALHFVYDDNHLSLLDFDTEIDCSILGDAAYKVIWDAVDKRVRVTAPDVQGLFAWWRGDDPTQVTRVASRYALSADQVADLYGFTPPKDQATIIEDWTQDAFSICIDGQVIDTVPNPYGFIPFVIYPNLREPKQFWGSSDLPVIMEPQRELNRAMSQLSRILELSGNPIAVLENVEEAEDIAIAPGAVWTLPEGTKAYLLDLLKGGGVRLHIDYINLLYRTMHDLSEAPRAAFGGTERDLSGIALQVEMQSLVQKASRKRLIRTAAYRKRNDMILALLAQKTGAPFAGIHSDIVWSPLLPQDQLTLARTEQLLVTSNLHSRYTAMTELGILDPEAELARLVAEQRQLAILPTAKAPISSVPDQAIAPTITPP
ncbi:MAG: phage portal protein [Chloroflexota bacterium]